MALTSRPAIAAAVRRRSARARASRASRARSCIVLLLAWVVGPASLAAQAATPIDPTPTCPRCTIAPEPVVTIGRPEDDVSVIGASTMVRDRRGNHYVAPTATVREIAVYGPDGRYHTWCGCAGEGPGELARVRPLAVLPGDSLLVLDDRGLTLFSPSGAYVRARRFTEGISSFRFAVLPDGRVLLNNYGQCLRRLVLLDQSFRVVRSFGVAVEGVPPDLGRMQFSLAVARDGQIIAAAFSYRHVMEVRDTAGALRRAFAVDPDWYRAWTAEAPAGEGSFRLNPHPRVTAIWYDGRGRLWVRAVVASSEFASISRAVAGARELPSASVTARAYDTIVEVLNLDAGTVLAVPRLHQPIHQFLADRLVYGARDDTSGTIHFEVSRAVLRGR